MRSVKSALWLLVLLITATVSATGEAKHPKENFFKVVLSTVSAKQGSTVTVFVESALKLKKIELDCFGRPHPIYRIWHKDHDHLFRTFIGIPATLKPGDYKIIARAVDVNGENIKIYNMLRVKPRAFTLQKVNLPLKKRSLMSQDIIQKESNLIGSKLKIRGKRVYFATEFLMPTTGRISGTFGGRRQYNNGGTSSYHKGLDIANKRGTAIIAANGGKVTLSKSMDAHGKTVLINHGHGISTIYCHMNAIKVKQGDWIKRGQLIGNVGSTGIATGPYLHFGFSVNDIRVDPTLWINGQVKLYYRP